MNFRNLWLRKRLVGTVKINQTVIISDLTVGASVSQRATAQHASAILTLHTLPSIYTRIAVTGVYCCLAQFPRESRQTHTLGVLHMSHKEKWLKVKVTSHSQGQGASKIIEVNLFLPYSVLHSDTSPGSYCSLLNR